MNEYLPIQNDSPNTVFIFGAGASYPDGIPLQKDIIPKLLNDNDAQLRKSDISIKIKQFIKENFSHEEQYPSLEEVFGFIEFFLSNEFSLSKKWNYQSLIKLKYDLTKVLHYIISKGSGHSQNFETFWNTIKKNNREMGVVTTNYDTLIDDACDKISRVPHRLLYRLRKL